jgi:hypothetical protein
MSNEDKLHQENIPEFMYFFIGKEIRSIVWGLNDPK